MEEKCCTFAGHRTAPQSMKEEMIPIITDLVENKNVTTFYVGSQGSFDSSSVGAVKAVKQKFPAKKIRLVLVVPKMSDTLNRHKKVFESLYDDVMIPTESDAAHYKSMITIRNRWMVDHSDYIITYIRLEHGGAYTTYRYAKKQQIEIIEV